MTERSTLEHHTLSSAKYTLHYVAQGDPRHELVVFLHPAFGDHRCFAQQLDVFATQNRVVAVDMLGHGMSQVAGAGSIADTSALVADIIAREGHQSAHLVGVSLGSLIAQDVAARFPSAVTSLTVVGGYTIFGVSREIQRAQGGEMVKWLLMVLFSMNRFRRYLARTSVISRQSRETFYRSAQLFTRRSFRLMPGMKTVFRPEYRPHRHPLQIIVGDHDLPLIRTVAQTWHHKEPASEYHLIANAGHCANMDNPADFNALLLSFVARHSTHYPSS
jgi:pimeloyl-ACP methyl ester carboxylesterase